jgi:hypothetical protein
MQTFVAMLDSIQLHWNALKATLLLSSPKAHMSSQYLCGRARPDTSNNIHEVFIRDDSGEMQRVRAVIDCGETSIFMAPRL